MDKVIIRCLVAPVMNRKAGIILWHEGDATEVEINGFWKNQIERGSVEVVETDESSEQNPQVKTISRMNKDDLLALATELQIDTTELTTRNDLIDAIKAKQAENAAGTGE